MDELSGRLKRLKKHEDALKTFLEASKGPFAGRELKQSLEALEELIQFARGPSEAVIFDMNVFTERVADFARDDSFKDVVVDHHFASGPLWVLGQPVAIRRVLVNLLNNARDAIGKPEQGFGRIDVSTERDQAKG